MLGMSNILPQQPLQMPEMNKDGSSPRMAQQLYSM